MRRKIRAMRHRRSSHCLIGRCTIILLNNQHDGTPGILFFQRPHHAENLVIRLTGRQSFRQYAVLQLGLEKQTALGVLVAEFRQGNAIVDFFEPDRVVLGVQSDLAKRILDEVYWPLHYKNIPFLYTTVESAEAIKVAREELVVLRNCFNDKIEFLKTLLKDYVVLTR